MTALQSTSQPEQKRILDWLQSPPTTSILSVWLAPTLDESFDAFSRDALRHARIHPKDALRVVDRVTPKDRKNLSNPNRIKLVRLQAHVLSHAGKLKESGHLYRRAWDLSVRLKLREQIVFTGLGWINILSLLGQYDEAQRIGKRSLAKLKKSERVLRARLLTNLGVVYHRWGRHKEASNLLRDSRRTLKAMGFRYDYAYVSYSYGFSLLLQGDSLGIARKCFQEALAYFVENKLKTLELYARTALALTDLSEGRYQEAMKSLEQLHDDLESLGDKRATALIRRQQAEFLGAVGALKEAEALARLASETYHELGMVGDAATSAYFHAQILRELGRYMDARVRLEESLSHWVLTKNRLARQRVELELAATFLDRGSAGEALVLLRRLLRSLGERERFRIGARARHLLAKAYMHQGRVGLARRHAMAAYEDAREYPYKLEKPWIALTIAATFNQKGSEKESVLWARRAVLEQEALALRLGNDIMREQISGSKKRLYSEATEIILAQDKKNGAKLAVDLLSRARSPQLVSDLLWEAPPIDARLRMNIKRVRQEMMSSLDSVGENYVLPTLQKQMKTIDRQLAARSQTPSPILRKALKARKFSSWSTRLGSKTLVIYDKAPKSWSAYVIQDQRVRHVQLPDAVTVLAGAWWQLRFVMEQAAHLPKDRRKDFLEGTLDEATRCLTQLRAALMDPLEIKEGSIAFIPDGELHELPLEAIAFFSTEEGSGLDAVRWPHPAIMKKKRQDISPSALLLHNGSTGTKRETKQIGGLLKRRGFATTVSSRTGVFENNEDRYGVLHAASHGNFHRNRWVLNGIQLKNGWLGFEQLRSANLKNALMYLGSCDSGLQNEASGLSFNGWLTAGLGAGASELMLSLWKIDDETATAYARAFYPKWYAGVGMARAARTAREQVRALYPHPFSWAPFLVVG